MNEMAEAFRQAGGDVEYYYCSSDPTSLDGIFASCGGYNVAVIDGTAPHAEDISTPGTKDNLIDLGRFWNVSELREAENSIAELAAKKSRAYAMAYRLLAAYGGLMEAADELATKAVDFDLISDQCARLAENIPREKLLRTPLSAVGMRGAVSFDSFAEAADFSFAITDSRSYGIAHLFFGELVGRIGGRAAPHPVLQGRYCAILADGVAVVEKSSSETVGCAIDASEFVDRSVYLINRERIDRLRTLADSALNEAFGFFAEAGEAHMNIEKIFSAAMNFGEKEAYSRDLCDKIRQGDL
jgi:hypothetical protein